MSSGDEGEAIVGDTPSTVALPLEIIPVVIHQGRYRLYEKPDGGMRLQYKRDDRDAEDYIELPGAMVKLFNKAQEGNMSPMEFMRAMMGMMKGGYGK